MERKFNSNASLRATQAGGIRAAANVMNYLKSNVEASVMKELLKKIKMWLKNYKTICSILKIYQEWMTRVCSF